MAVVDLKSKTITLKVVYYGCAMGGKTTNLISLHRMTDAGNADSLVSIATKDDRTLFFDLLPMDLGQIGGLQVKVKAYTVPGQVKYEATRKQVLAGADGVVMVVDSAPDQRDVNVRAVESLRLNLRNNRLDPDKVSTIFQWNKRDLPDARLIREMNTELNIRELPSFEAIATTGEGVVETFAAILKQAIAEAYSKSGRSSVTEEQISSIVDRALSDATCQSVDHGEEDDFDLHFDMDKYRKEMLARHDGDADLLDEESLIGESIRTNMALAEKLQDCKSVEKGARNTAGMLRALAQLGPALADGSNDGLPSGVMASLMHAVGRQRGSLLLLHEGDGMLDHEVIPSGVDILNTSIPGVGSAAGQLFKDPSVRLIEDVAEEIFFNAMPPGGEDLRSVLLLPLVSDGTPLGGLAVYGAIDRPEFDEVELAYWTSAAAMIAMGLHWRSMKAGAASTAGD